MNLLRVILCALAATLPTIAPAQSPDAQTPQKATLLKATTFTAIMDGKAIGSVQLPQGAQVTILSTNGDKVLLAQSALVKAWVNKADVAIPEPMTPTVPKPTPTPTPQPTPTPIVESKPTPEPVAAETPTREDTKPAPTPIPLPILADIPKDFHWERSIFVPGKLCFLALPFQKQEKGGICTAAAAYNVLSYIDPSLHLEQTEIFKLFSNGKDKVGQANLESGIKNLGFQVSSLPRFRSSVKVTEEMGNQDILVYQKSLEDNRPIIAGVTGHAVTIVGYRCDVQNGKFSKRVIVWDQNSEVEENGMPKGAYEVPATELGTRFNLVLLINKNSQDTKWMFGHSLLDDELEKQAEANKLKPKEKHRIEILAKTVNLQKHAVMDAGTTHGERIAQYAAHALPQLMKSATRNNQNVLVLTKDELLVLKPQALTPTTTDKTPLDILALPSEEIRKTSLIELAAQAVDKDVPGRLNYYTADSVQKNTSPSLLTQDAGLQWIDPAFWTQNKPCKEWEEWTVYSHTSTEKVYSERPDGETVFGSPAFEVKIHLTHPPEEDTDLQKLSPQMRKEAKAKAAAEPAGLPQLVEVTYLEKGLIVEGLQGKDFNTALRDLPKNFRVLSDNLQAALAKQFGKPEIVTIGQGLTSTQAKEYHTANLVLRLTTVPNLLIALTIQETATGSGRLLTAKTPETSGTAPNQSRAAETLANVVEKDGNKIIGNIPMSDQNGRGYCLIATIAMVANYYHLNITTETLAAKTGASYAAGYTYGAVAPVLQSLANQGRLQLQHQTSISSTAAMAYIDRGIPIIVARKVKGGAGHAEIITGYNKAEKVFFLTDSFGENSRNVPYNMDDVTSNIFEVIVLSPN